MVPECVGCGRPLSDDETQWCNGCISVALLELDGNAPDDDDDDYETIMEKCGMMSDGVCMYLGTAYCEWKCPIIDYEEISNG